MTSHPVIGWERDVPVPNYTFNDYLSARGGRLYFEDLDLAQLFLGDCVDQGLGRTFPRPLKLRKLTIHRNGNRINNSRYSG